MTKTYRGALLLALVAIFLAVAMPSLISGAASIYRFVFNAASSGASSQFSMTPFLETIPAEG